MLRLSLFRRFARSVVFLLLLAGPAGLQHSGKDDLACVAGGASDGDVTELGAAPDDTVEHCLVCHWTRSLRSPSASVVRLRPTLVAAARADVRQAVPDRDPSLDRAPARAPPPAF